MIIDPRTKDISNHGFRVACLMDVLDQENYTVREITEQLEGSVFSVTRTLKYLVTIGVVEQDKDSRNGRVLYSLVKEKKE